MLGERPANWTSQMNNNSNTNNNNNGGNNSEMGAAVTDGVEFLMCGLTFPKSAKLLKDKDIWIADTGASVHTVPHKYGFENLKNLTPVDPITVGKYGFGNLKNLTPVDPITVDNGTTESAGVICGGYFG